MAILTIVSGSTSLHKGTVGINSGYNTIAIHDPVISHAGMIFLWAVEALSRSGSVAAVMSYLGKLVQKVESRLGGAKLCAVIGMDTSVAIWAKSTVEFGGSTVEPDDDSEACCGVRHAVVNGGAIDVDVDMCAV